MGISFVQLPVAYPNYRVIREAPVEASWGKALNWQGLFIMLRFPAPPPPVPN